MQQASAPALLVLLLCCAAQPTSSLSDAGSWPWSRRSAQPPRPAQTDEKAEAAQTDEEAEAAALPALFPLSEDSSGGPWQPGCYMRMPGGCPDKPMRTEIWRQDPMVDQKQIGDPEQDRVACQRRKRVWDKYCGSTAAQMAFVEKVS